MRGVYAYVCGKCRHLLSTEHLLRQNEAGEWIVHCRVCDCTTTQDAPALTLDQRGYEQYLSQRRDSSQTSTEVDDLPADRASLPTAPTRTDAGGGDR